MIAGVLTSMFLHGLLGLLAAWLVFTIAGVLLCLIWPFDGDE